MARQPEGWPCVYCTWKPGNVSLYSLGFDQMDMNLLNAAAQKIKASGEKASHRRFSVFLAALAIISVLSLPEFGWANVVVTAGPNLSPPAPPQCNNTGAVSASCSYVGQSEYHYGWLNSTSTSFADLATGILAASAGTPGLGVGQAYAQLNDTISLILPAGYNSNIVPVTLSLNFTSVFLTGEASASDALSLGLYNSASGFIGSGHNGSGAPLDQSITLNFSTSNINNIPISAVLSVYAGDNYGNGYVNIDPDLSLTLPAGVTFTSGSGALLTQTQAVPEPTSLSLLGAGLIGMGLLRRRRKVVN